jgi:deazaflavin-dependent oxidoreductase (nitroreductase family)
MAFDTPNGTRGARQPGRSRIEQRGNRWMVDRIRRKGAKDDRQVVLVTIGKRTGRERMNPVRSFPEPDGSRLIVASANGAPRNPAWYYNIAANPERVRIEYAGTRVEVMPSQLHGDERATAWRRITTEAPGFAKYERITDREMPVIRLTPRDSSDSA